MRVSWDQIRPALRPRWDRERAEATKRLVQRRRRRAMVRDRLLAAGFAGVALLGAMAFGVARFRSTTPSSRAATVHPIERGVPADNGTEVVALSPSTHLVQPEGDPRSYRLLEGAAEFHVTHNEARPFRVVAERVVIEDVGTSFTVEIVAPGQVKVHVREGRVRVSNGEERVELAGGEGGEFLVPELYVPRSPPAPPLGTPSAAAPPDALPHAPSAAEAPATWKQLAQAGDYERAYEVLEQNGLRVREDAAELLLAADVARWSNHLPQAAEFLQRVVRIHPRDPRAPLAAFMLGRVLLDELGRPREAAEAFGRVSSEGGPLAEDALAREVEAFGRAGETGKARKLAEEYLARYPKGRRERAVRTFGGIP